MVNKFYNKLFKNLNSDKLFYTYDEKNLYYKDLKEFFLRFCNLINFLPSKNNRICILSEKCFELYATSLSIILTNNTWVPIAESSPEKRIYEIIDIVKPDLFVIQELNTLKTLKIKNYLKKKKINLITFSEIKNSRKVPSLKINKFEEKDISMIFFTSGSTGKPKGVKITHSGYIHSLLEQVDKLYKKQNNLIFGDYHDISFVISLNILLPAFYLGCAISPAINIKDIVFPINHAIANKVNSIVTVPTLINKVRNYYKTVNKKFNLKNLILCGEPFFVETLDYLNKKNLATNIYNCYGSTELSPWVFSHKIDKENYNFYKSLSLVPIGKPFKKVKTKIINEKLFVGGPTLCNGYLDKTQNIKSFHKINSVLYYQTNDYVEVKKGLYIVKGRSDNIVKIQGYRVELLEIENVIRKLKNVKNCLVFIKNMSNYEKIICAAIETSSLKMSRVETHIRKYLPNYMVPKFIKLLRKFPVNRSNKVDKIEIKSFFIN